MKKSKKLIHFQNKGEVKHFNSKEEKEAYRKSYVRDVTKDRKPHIAQEAVELKKVFNEDGSIEGYYLEGRKLRANIFEDFQSEEEKK